MKASEIRNNGYYWMRLHSEAEWQPVKVMRDCVKVIGTGSHDHLDEFTSDTEFMPAVLPDSGTTE